jgi:hypothetical protein
LSFIPNAGQTEEAAVRFVVQHLGGALFFTPNEVVLEILNPSVDSPEDEQTDEALSTTLLNYSSLAPSVVRIKYQGANADPQVSGVDPLPGVANYLLGNDPGLSTTSAWRANLPTYAGIVYQQLYPGIDLRFEGTQGQLKSLFLVSPGADPASIRWSYSGAKAVSLDGEGNLLVSLPKPRGAKVAATLREQAPVAWQERDGVRQAVAVRHEVAGDGSVGFVLPDGYDSSLPLVIDPVLSYSTLLGRSEKETGMGIVIAPDGSAYMTGSTTSSDFPAVGTLQGYVDGEDVYISKLSPDGSALLYSTFLGGEGHDKGRGIALDSSGRIAVVGETESSDFPTLNAYDSSYAGGSCASGPCDDVFVAQLTPDGSALRYSSYLGGAWDEEGEEIAVDANCVLHKFSQ